MKEQVHPTRPCLRCGVPVEHRPLVTDWRFGHGKVSLCQRCRLEKNVTMLEILNTLPGTVVNQTDSLIDQRIAVHRNGVIWLSPAMHELVFKDQDIDKAFLYANIVVRME